MIKGHNTRMDDSVPGVTKTVQSNWVKDKKSYVNGGVTFTYPDGFFSSAPHVFVTLELTGMSYSDGITVTPLITANSNSSTTVRVNCYSEGPLELSDNEAIIHLYAEAI